MARITIDGLNPKPHCLSVKFISEDAAGQVIYDVRYSATRACMHDHINATIPPGMEFPLILADAVEISDTV